MRKDGLDECFLGTAEQNVCVAEMIPLLNVDIRTIPESRQDKSSYPICQKVDLLYTLSLLKDIFLLLHVNRTEELDDPNDKAFVLILEELYRLIYLLVYLKRQLYSQLVRQVVHKIVEVSHLLVVIVVDRPNKLFEELRVQ